MRYWLLTTALIGHLSLASATIHSFDHPVDETRYQALINDFRCPTCQNQNLAGSDAPIAVALKQKTYEMIKDGRTDGEIRDYMFERYGDYISYKPPVRPSTWILWFFPPLLLLIVLSFWVVKNKRPTPKPMSATTATALNDDEEARVTALLDKYKDTR